MKVAGTFVFALAVFVNYTVCYSWRQVSPRERVFRYSATEGDNVWYKHVESPHEAPVLRPVLGPHNFLERDGYLIGFGQDNTSIREMRDNMGKPFIVHQHGGIHEIGEHQLPGLGVGERMPPYRL